MAKATHYQEYGFVSDDPPVRLKTEEDLLPYSAIDEPTRKWLDSLEYIWSLWKKSVTVTETLHQYFDTAPNPYLSTLRILVNSKDFHCIKNKASLAFTVIEEFSNWIAPNKDKFESCLSVEIKTAAFRLVTKQKSVQLIKTVSEVYEFSSSKEHFVDFIKDMIKNKKYKDAGVYVEMLKLQCTFDDPEELLMPLILQNKNTIAEDLLKNQPELQIKFVSYLDNLLAHANVKNFIDQYINEIDLPEVKFQYNQHKSISKLVARLAKLYNVPSHICPNLNKKRGEGALQFLIYKRYVENSLSVESWREMAKEAIGSESSLKTEILKGLTNANDPAEAYYFAQCYDIPQDEWPWSVQKYAENNPNCNGKHESEREESWDTENNDVSYYTLNLPRDRIKIINDAKSFEEFLDYALLNVHIIGIDSEWKPSFSIKKPEVALMQIATHSHVYIFDVTVLGNSVQELWKELGLALFNNKSILKLGFGIANDISVFRESLPVLSNIRACGEGYLDLSHLWKKLLKEDSFVFPYEGDESFTNENLSKLVELCLGQRLNKSDQFSNWERRPLRESQITYAALDAYCLLEVYDVLAKQCERLGIPFQEVLAHIHEHKSSMDQDGQKSLKNEAKKSRDSYNLSNKQAFWMSVQQACVSPPPQNHQSQSSFSHQNAMPTNDRHATLEAHSTVPGQTAQPPELAYHQQQPQCQPSPSQHQEQPANINSWPKLQYQQQRQLQQPRRFVCDSMLGGLVRQLRKCGIDSLHVPNDRGGEQSLRLAYDQQRVLLTRHGNFYRFRNYLPRGYCYSITESRTEDQLIEIIRYYNIKVNEADIFSRCQICNSNEFVYISKDTMSELFKSHRSKKNARPGVSGIGEAGGSATGDVYNHWDTESKAVQQMQSSNEKQFTARSWLLSYGSLNVASCTTKYNARVQIDQVPMNMLRFNFYVCERCGKVYWYGSHVERAFNGNLRNILS